MTYRPVLTEHRHEVLQFQRDSSLAKAEGEKEALSVASTSRAVELAKLGKPVSGLALSVGPRTIHEITMLAGFWGCEVQGVDLFTEDDRIRVADMGALPFGDAGFAAVLSCHSLEHSFDALEALLEFERVLAPKGQLFIEVPYFHHNESVPIRFQKGADRWNFGTIVTLLRSLPGSLSPTYHRTTASALQLVARKA